MPLNEHLYQQPTTIQYFKHKLSDFIFLKILKVNIQPIKGTECFEITQIRRCIISDSYTNLFFLQKVCHSIYVEQEFDVHQKTRWSVLFVLSIPGHTKKTIIHFAVIFHHEAQ